MFAHLLRLVLGVQNAQLGEHAHVGAFQAESRFKQVNQFLKVATILVIVDQVLQLVGMDDYMQAAHLSETELLVVDAGEAHFLPCASAVGLACRVDGALEFCSSNDPSKTLLRDAYRNKPVDSNQPLRWTKVMASRAKLETLL